MCVSNKLFGCCPVLVFRILLSLALLVLAFRRRKSFGACAPCVCLYVCVCK